MSVLDGEKQQMKIKKQILGLVALKEVIIKYVRNILSKCCPLFESKLKMNILQPFQPLVFYDIVSLSIQLCVPALKMTKVLCKSVQFKAQKIKTDIFLACCNVLFSYLFRISFLHLLGLQVIL